MIKPTFPKLPTRVSGVATLVGLSTFAAALVAVGAGAASAGSLGRPCTVAPQAQWLSIEALQSKLQTQGYTIRSAKLKNACGEVYATDAQGSRVELFLDPTSGDIVGRL